MSTLTRNSYRYGTRLQVLFHRTLPHHSGAGGRECDRVRKGLRESLPSQRTLFRNALPSSVPLVWVLPAAPFTLLGRLYRTRERGVDSREGDPGVRGHPRRRRHTHPHRCRHRRRCCCPRHRSRQVDTGRQCRRGCISNRGSLPGGSSQCRRYVDGGDGEGSSGVRRVEVPNYK